jgi:hypothetical protein
MFIAKTRPRIADVMEIDVQYTTAVAVANRYAELIRLKEEKDRNRKRQKPAGDLTSQIPSYELAQPQLFKWLISAS